MVNRRDERLDGLLNQLVKITFCDKTEYTGVLEFDMSSQGFNPHMYSIFVFGQGYIFFYKSHVTRIQRWEDAERSLYESRGQVFKQISISSGSCRR